jgi:hypothetical protein
MDDVFDYVESNRARFVDELCILLRQPSISTQDTGVRECASLVQRFMTDAGAEARLLETGGYPVVFGEMPGTPRRSSPRSATGASMRVAPATTRARCSPT